MSVARARRPAAVAVNGDYVMRLSYTAVSRNHCVHVAMRSDADWRMMNPAWPDVEHILLESDERVVPTLETARRIHARLVLQGGPWRRSLELALIDYFYLSVRTARAQSVDSRYVVDLRFVDPVPRLKRQVAWRWIAVGAHLPRARNLRRARHRRRSMAPLWRHEWLPLTAALFGVAAYALFAAFHLTTETLTLFSAHGQATLVAHTGRVGTFRAFQGFLPRLRRTFGSRSAPVAGRAPST